MEITGCAKYLWDNPIRRFICIVILYNGFYLPLVRKLLLLFVNVRIELNPRSCTYNLQFMNEEGCQLWSRLPPDENNKM